MDKITLLLSWLCCKKNKDKHKRETEGEVEATRPADTGQGGCQPTDSEHQQGGEPPWVRKYFQAAPHKPEELEPEYFESDYDDDDDEDTEEESVDEDNGDDPNEEKFNFPFHDSTFRFPHKDYDEIWKTRRPTKRKTRDKKEMKKKDGIGEFSLIPEYYKCKKRKEIDSDHRRRWRGHCHETSRREKDIIEDQCRPMRDVCMAVPTGGFDNFDTCNLSQYRPTPMLSIEIVQGHENPFTFSTLPDTGSTKAIIAKNIADKHNITYDKSYDGILTDAQGHRMDVSGLARILIRPKNINGDLNVEGEYTNIPCLISDTLKNEMFLSWRDLQRIGSISPHFPEVWTKEALWTSSRATMTTEDRARNTRLHPKIEAVFEEFDEVFAEDLRGGRHMEREMDIVLDEDIAKYKRGHYGTDARRPPICMEQAANDLIDELEEVNIIAKCEGPVDFLARAHFVMKADGKRVRLVTDYSDSLNPCIKREHHGFTCARDIRESLDKDAKFYCILDLPHAYFQVPLTPEASKLTAFIVNTGKGAHRYVYLRSPMGLVSTSDFFNRETDLIFAGLPGVKKLVDDILIEARSLEEMEERVRTVLKQAKLNNVTISRSKTQYGSTVKFGGFVVSSKNDVVSVEPDPDLLKDLREFKTPTNISEVRGFTGLARQISDYNPDLSQSLTRMYKLLKKETPFIWDQEVDKEFEDAKKRFTQQQELHPFDPNKRTQLITDASRLFGLGYALMQETVKAIPAMNGREAVPAKWHMIKCGSVTLTDCQRRYATCELESLAICWALKKCRYFLEGHPFFEVWTDHKPLEALYKTDLRDVTNTRIHNFREKTAHLNFKVTWTPGKYHCIADALSRSPAPGTFEDGEPPAEHFIIRKTADAGCQIARKDALFKSIFKAAGEDMDYQHMIEAVKMDIAYDDLEEGHPGRELIMKDWHSLAIMDDLPDTLLIYHSNKVFIPKEERKNMLDILHTSHGKTASMIEKAKMRFFWPHMRKDIERTAKSCTACAICGPKQMFEPPVINAEQILGMLPMDEIAADYGVFGGKNFLIVADRASSYAFCQQTKG